MKWRAPEDGHSARQKFQADYYAHLATDFDAQCGRENANHLYKIEQIAATFFRHLPPGRSGYDFLELGAGTGIHAYHFLKDNHSRINRLVLSDISADMLAQAEKRLAEFRDKLELVVMSAEELALDRKFDGIFVSGSMHHFADPQVALKQIKKHLVPSGLVIVCEPVIWNPVNFVKAVREIRAEYGQFKTQRRQVRRYLKQLDLTILSDRVLHYRAGHALLRRCLPYRKMERCALLNPLAVMFLLAAVNEPCQ